jgi:uncharacterized membrane protein
MPLFAREHHRARWAPLVCAGVLSLVSLALQVYMLRTVVHQSAAARTVHMGVAIYAVLVTWVMLHTVFAIRYAYRYYAPSLDDPDRPTGGLVFPGNSLAPDYWDFLYYAFTIAMCGSTSDIQVVHPEMRRLTLLHGLFAFFYNVGLFSMLISTVAGAF